MSQAGEHEARERSAARSLLMASDCVTAAAVALLALNGLRPGASLVGIVLIVAAAIVPRLAAELIESPRALFQRGRQLTPVGLLLMGAVLLALPVAYRAFELPSGVGAGLGFELILLAMVWIAGFGLRDPATYVVYEPLALATVLLSLARGAAHAGPLVAAAFLAVCISGALRRQLAHSTDSKKSGRVNVRSARILGALAALALIVVFTLSNETLQPVLKRTSAPLARGGAREAPAKRPGEPRDGDEEPGESETSGQSGESTAPGDAGDPRESGGRESEDGRRDPVGRPGDRLARSRRVPANVAAPSLRRGDTLIGEGRNAGPVILRVTPAEPGPENDGRRGARPDARTLWKGRTYSRFDAPKQEWVDDDASQWVTPFADDRTIRLGPDRGRAAATWEATMVADRLDCLLLPYSTHEINLETSGSAADLRTNLNGDLTWARLGLRVSPTYWIVVQPLGAGWAETAPGLLPAPPALPAEIEFPPPPAFLVDFVALARTAMGPDDGALSVKIAKLRACLQAKFRYARPDTKRLPEDFGQFLREKRVGVAEHFATAAALLFRASGVPTRLVKGYSGGRWDSASGVFVVRSGNSHSWIEISTTEGWLPLDPADWVLSAPPGRAEEEPAAQAPQKPERDRDADPSPPLRPPGWLVFAVAFTALALSLFGFFRKRRSERRPEEEPEIEEEAPADAPDAPEFVPRTPAERLLVEYGRLQGDLAVTGQERRKHETPREHSRRVSVPPRAKVDEAFSSLVPMIDDGLYGHLDLSEADLERGRRDIAELRKELG